MITGKSTWEGFEQIDISLNGHEGFVIVPQNPVEGNKWIWRAEFFGAFDTADRALLADGYYLAYYKVSDMYGCDESIRLMKGFHDFVVQKLGLHAKTVLLGFSRGGLYSANYAWTYPEDVACLYLDAPVLDLKSWPCCYGRTSATRELLPECLGWYHLTEEELMRFKGNPLDRAAELAQKHIPIIIVAGDADTAVPIEENALPFEKAFTAAGGDCALIVKPGCDHHPHSLDDPAPIVAFIEKRY